MVERKERLPITMITEDDLCRIGVSLPNNLLGQFDEILKYRQYTSRSEGIRDAIRIYTINNQWISDSTGLRKGVITIVYNFRTANLSEFISDIRNQYRDAIQTIFMRQVSEERRVEIMVVRGTSTELRELADSLAEKKGIESVRITTVSLS
ncbi:ribbon-helix-helix protein, CopG family [Methanoregula formicica]|uniref:Putative nickel-responsive regulator n=1 Tax=Methanoregula formicica (strain DSM 22288 / NBRC 105244 / SMSP) TaxID=593750 RepID=L0HDP1_METFS|nr:ribbon-helix-helix protein, CopG family [Methanoregula formicica]AGB01911.1 putative transcriptional regulator with CopG/Arc/MetJ DNA-binding domain and metal-binding domain [Methanoregula formicica SMSP]